MYFAMRKRLLRRPALRLLACFLLLLTFSAPSAVMGAGAVTEFPVPTANSGPAEIITGPDGNLWFTERNTTNLGRITPAGVITEFPPPDPGSLEARDEDGGITAGPDGNLWFIEGNSDVFGWGFARMTPAGVITGRFPIPPQGWYHFSPGSALTAGPDGNLWFTELGDAQHGDMIGRMTLTGVITQFFLPTPNSEPRGITAGPDGNLWFAEVNANQIGRITPTGTITEFALPTPNSGPGGVTVGPDGNFWFTEFYANQIGRITTGPASSATLALAYNGKLRDRVGQDNTALGPDGALDGTLTATLSASDGRTITALQLQSTGPGFWDTGANTPYWVLGVAGALDGPLLNDPATMAVNFPVTNGGSFVLFAADYQGVEFVPGTTLTLTATFSDGTTATAVTTVPAGATLALAYNGKLRDRVGQGNTALSPDGALDGTLTATLGASGGRTINALQLQSTGPGTWDTGANTPYWVLGVAGALDGPLLNDPATVAVNFPVASGGSFVLFAADYQGIEFVSGTTLTLTVSFSDGTTATATTVVP